MKRVLQIVFGSGVVIGVLSMVVGLAVTFGAISWGGELPWSGVQDVRCYEGRVYVGLEYFSSILEYDEHGRHVRTIPVPTHGKPYLFSVQQDGRIDVSRQYAARSGPVNFRLVTERLKRTLELSCGYDEPRVLQQSVFWLLVAGPLPGVLLAFLCILGLLATAPSLLVALLGRSK
jgi:hypothetical protein